MRWWAAVEWIDQVIKKGLKSVDEVEIFYVEGRSVSADLKQKKINLASASEDCGLGIRTIHKGRIGSSSTNDPRHWSECLDAAIASGHLATPLPWEGLPGAQGISQTPLTFDPLMKVEPASALALLEQMLAGAEEHQDGPAVWGRTVHYGLAREGGPSFFGEAAGVPGLLCYAYQVFAAVPKTGRL